MDYRSNQSCAPTGLGALNTDIRATRNTGNMGRRMKRPGEHICHKVEAQGGQQNVLKKTEWNANFAEDPTPFRESGSDIVYKDLYESSYLDRAILKKIQKIQTQITKNADLSIIPSIGPSRCLMTCFMAGAQKRLSPSQTMDTSRIPHKIS